MKWLKLVVVGGLIFLSASVCVPGRAEAGVGNWVQNSVVYLYRPVPALWNYGKGLLACVVDKSVTFVAEVVGNINANPMTLQPLVPPPVPQPGS